MSLLGLGGRWKCIYTGRRGDCDACNVSGCPISSRTIVITDGVKNNLPPPPPPSVECPQRCGTCWRASKCQALKDYLEFAKEITPADNFKSICADEDRTNPHFRDCMNCSQILFCPILKRVMSLVD